MRAEVRAGGRNGTVYGPTRRSHAKAHLTMPVSRIAGMRGTNMSGGPGAGNASLPRVNVPGPGANAVEPLARCAEESGSRLQMQMVRLTGTGYGSL